MCETHSDSVQAINVTGCDGMMSYHLFVSMHSVTPQNLANTSPSHSTPLASLIPSYTSKSRSNHSAYQNFPARASHGHLQLEPPPRQIPNSIPFSPPDTPMYVPIHVNPKFSDQVYIQFSLFIRTVHIQICCRNEMCCIALHTANMRSIYPHSVHIDVAQAGVDRSERRFAWWRSGMADRLW